VRSQRILARPWVWAGFFRRRAGGVVAGGVGVRRGRAGFGRAVARRSPGMAEPGAAADGRRPRLLRLAWRRFLAPRLLARRPLAQRLVGPAVAAGAPFGAAAAYSYYGYGYYDTCWQNRPSIPLAAFTSATRCQRLPVNRGFNKPRAPWAGGIACPPPDANGGASSTCDTVG